MNNASNNQGGRGTNITDADRKKGGTHSHQAQGAEKTGRGSNLTDADRKKGGQHSHDNKK